MQCEQAEMLLAQLVFDELDPPLRQELLAHLDQCPACTEVLGDLRVTVNLLHEGVAVSPAPVLSEGRLATLRKAARQVRKPRTQKQLSPRQRLRLVSREWQRRWPVVFSLRGAGLAAAGLGLALGLAGILGAGLVTTRGEARRTARRLETSVAPSPDTTPRSEAEGIQEFRHAESDADAPIVPLARFSYAGEPPVGWTLSAGSTASGAEGKQNQPATWDRSLALGNNRSDTSSFYFESATPAAKSGAVANAGRADVKAQDETLGRTAAGLGGGDAGHTLGGNWTNSTAGGGNGGGNSFGAVGSVRHSATVRHDALANTGGTLDAQSVDAPVQLTVKGVQESRKSRVVSPETPSAQAGAAKGNADHYRLDLGDRLDAMQTDVAGEAPTNRDGEQFRSYSFASASPSGGGAGGAVTLNEGGAVATPPAAPEYRGGPLQVYHGVSYPAGAKPSAVAATPPPPAAPGVVAVGKPLSALDYVGQAGDTATVNGNVTYINGSGVSPTTGPVALQRNQGFTFAGTLPMPLGPAVAGNRLDTSDLGSNAVYKGVRVGFTGATGGAALQSDGQTALGNTTLNVNGGTVGGLAANATNAPTVAFRGGSTLDVGGSGTLEIGRGETNVADGAITVNTLTPAPVMLGSGTLTEANPAALPGNLTVNATERLGLGFQNTPIGGAITYTGGTTVTAGNATVATGAPAPAGNLNGAVNIGGYLTTPPAPSTGAVVPNGTNAAGGNVYSGHTLGARYAVTPAPETGFTGVLSVGNTVTGSGPNTGLVVPSGAYGTTILSSLVPNPNPTSGKVNVGANAVLFNDATATLNATDAPGQQPDAQKTARERGEQVGGNGVLVNGVTLTLGGQVAHRENATGLEGTANQGLGLAYALPAGSKAGGANRPGTDWGLDTGGAIGGAGGAGGTGGAERSGVAHGTVVLSTRNDLALGEASSRGRGGRAEANAANDKTPAAPGLTAGFGTFDTRVSDPNAPAEPSARTNRPLGRESDGGKTLDSFHDFNGDGTIAYDDARQPTPGQVKLDVTDGDPRGLAPPALTLSNGSSVAKAGAGTLTLDRQHGLGWTEDGKPQARQTDLAQGQTADDLSGPAPATGEPAILTRIPIMNRFTTGKPAVKLGDKDRADKAYEVRDQLVDIPNFGNVASFDLSTALPPAGGEPRRQPAQPGATAVTEEKLAKDRPAGGSGPVDQTHWGDSDRLTTLHGTRFDIPAGATPQRTPVETILDLPAGATPQRDQVGKHLAIISDGLATDAETKPREAREAEGLVVELQQQTAEPALKPRVAETMTRATELLKARKFAEASEAVNEAKNTLDRNKGALPDGQYADLRGKANDLAGIIGDEKVVWEAKQPAEIEKRNKEEDLAAHERATVQKAQQVDALLRRATELRNERKLDDAAELTNQALFIDPQNVAAQAQKEMIEDGKIAVEYRGQRTRALNPAKHTTGNLETTVPHEEILLYPTDWPQLTERRLKGLKEGKDASEVDSRVAAKLQEPVPVNFDANELRNVVEYFRNTTGVNFFVNWPALEAAGVDQKKTISMQLTQVPAEQALKLVLQQASSYTDHDPLTYSIIDGIVTISTERDLATATDVRTYDVRDLLAGRPLLPTSKADAGREERLRELTTLIQDSVGKPEQWVDRGGNVSSLKEMNGSLIIKTTGEGHAKLARVLRALRGPDGAAATPPPPPPPAPPVAPPTAEKEEELPAAATFKAGPVNAFVMTEQERFSTFALDVDTASYSLTRNYLRKGYLPPAAAVRMEEFVNAFDYNYPRHTADAGGSGGASGGGGVFHIYADAAPSPFHAPGASGTTGTPGNANGPASAGASGGANLTLLKIGVQGKVIGREGRKPANLVFVIDTSGSMAAPDRLPLVQYALDVLLGQLAPTDNLSIVTFSNRASLVLGATPAAEKEKILAAVRGLKCQGSTNLLEGLQLGYQQAAAGFKPGQINRVILCSDGVANIGETDAAAMLAQVEAYKKQGITVTSVGLGMGAYNDEVMQKLADKGDGNYVFIDSPAEARRVFAEQMAATLQTIAKDAKIQVEFNPQRVRRYRLIGYEKRILNKEDFRNDAVVAGGVGSGQASTALYEVELLPGAEDQMAGGGGAAPGAPGAGGGGGGGDLGTVYVRYRDVDTNKVEEIAHRLDDSILARGSERTPESDPRFYLAAGAATFAEILRGSEYAKDITLPQVQSVLERVAAQFPLDTRVRELADLAHRAQGCPRAP